MRAKLAALLVFLASPHASTAQAWEAIQSLQPGSEIRIQDRDGRQHKGALISASGEMVSIRQGSSETAIERARVRRVQVRSNSRRARNILIGAGIGLAIGLVVDQTLGAYLRNETNEDNRALSFVAPIGLFGVIGALLPAYRTVYRSP